MMKLISEKVIFWFNRERDAVSEDAALSAQEVYSVLEADCRSSKPFVLFLFPATGAVYGTFELQIPGRYRKDDKPFEFEVLRLLNLESEAESKYILSSELSDGCVVMYQMKRITAPGKEGK